MTGKKWKNLKKETVRGSQTKKQTQTYTITRITKKTRGNKNIKNTRKRKELKATRAKP